MTGSNAEHRSKSFQELTKKLMQQQEKRALETLVRAGMDPDVLLVDLLAIPRLPRKLPPTVQGLSAQQLRRVPSRVRSWAETIELINTRAILKPLHFLTLDLVKEQMPGVAGDSDESISALLGNVASIPAALRFYADFLEKVWLPLKRQLPRNFNAQTWHKLLLIDRVREKTGRPHMEQLADLLTFTYRISGDKGNTPVTADDLKKLRDNCPIPMRLHILFSRD